MEKGSADDCWLWMGARDRAGYGRVGGDACGGRRPVHSAHRVSWELANGPITDPSLQACHKCDVPACVNPAHLFLGTAQDNSDDKVRKGRHNIGDRNGSRTCPDRVPRLYGERSGAAKLTWESVRAIRDAVRAGERMSTLARQFGVSQTTVWCVVVGRTWPESQDPQRGAA